ncbi:hypothetical protein FEM48_Zijuj03G0057200 [Ziziphus jujuba var. spinosa]|uniref:Alpha-1,6-glucosidases pullulanase-type C-terminal domain-containing protein n=1 Tax=Ziziphus jujuba var. spinosa TaxID=714518 RepID=A0A978VNI6_ZIZJJ|nr:hypothetical protein FEM48_Zijuj03G0057200 [Ziziphus jujuba var. spinosa]
MRDSRLPNTPMCVLISTVKPLHSLTCSKHPIRCCSSSSMSSQASPSTSPVLPFSSPYSVLKKTLGMAANLRDFALTDYEGKEVKGLEVLTRDGVPVAYASCPTETHHLLCSMVNLWIPCVQAHNLYEFRLSEPLILVSLDILNLTLMTITLQNHVIDIVKTFQVHYVSAHNNETLFDIVSLKGISFFHSGDEMLHSKSLDCDSYSSGDWMNGLDFTYNSNYWGVGHPPEEKNGKNWPLLQPGLADQLFKPQKNHILAALNNFSNFPALMARTLQLHPIQLILTDHVVKVLRLKLRQDASVYVQ